MSWFKVLKRNNTIKSRKYAKLFRAAVRPIVNEFVEKEIIPKTNKIYFREISQLIEEKFITDPKIKERIRADPSLSILHTGKINRLLDTSVGNISSMVTYKLANSGYERYTTGGKDGYTYYSKEEFK